MARPGGLRALAAIVVALLVPIVGQAAPAAAVGTASIAGVVTGDGGRPVTGATVSLTAYMAAMLPDLTTDGDGRYLALVEPGSYVISVAAVGYAQGVSATSVGEGGSATANVRLVRPVTVRGRVTNVEGQGLHSTLTVPPGAAATIAVDGFYEVTGLHPNNVWISFATNGYSPTIVRREAAAGAILEGVDVVLRRPGSVTGRVLNPDGSPAAFARVSWRPAAFYSGTVPFPTVTAGDGSFSMFGAVGSGNIQVEAVGLPPQMFDADGDGVADEVIVGDAAMVDAGTFTLAAAGAIEGQVIVAGVGRSGLRVEVQRLDWPGAFLTATTDPNGTYLVGDLAPGRYLVRFVAPDSTVSSEYWDNQSDPALADPVIVVGGATAQANAELDVTATISGTVTGPDGRPLVGASVGLALPVVPPVLTDETGRYRLAGVPWGTATVRVDAPVGSEAQTNRATLTVEPGALPTHDVRLLAGGAIEVLIPTSGFALDLALCRAPAQPQRVEPMGCSDGLPSSFGRFEFDSLHRFILHGVAPGEHLMAVATSDGSSTIATVHIQVDSRVTCTFSVDGPSTCGGGGGGGGGDTEPPAIVCPAPPTVLVNAAAEELTATATDAGAAWPVTVGLAARQVGSHTVHVEATDAAGNTGTVECAYQVHYRFDGFRSPVSNTRVNQVKAGQIVPFSFKLYDAGDERIGGLEAVASFTANVHPCPSRMKLKKLGKTSAASGLTLVKTGTYLYGWKPGSDLRGQCVTATVTLDDGTAHTAEFLVK